METKNCRMQGRTVGEGVKFLQRLPLVAACTLFSAPCFAQTALSCSYTHKWKKENFTVVFHPASQTVSIDGGAPQPAVINEATIAFPSSKRGYRIVISRISGVVTIGTGRNPREIQGSCTRSAQRF